MKKLLLLLFIIPFAGLSTLFAATDFNINFENLVMPSDELYVEKVALEPIETDVETKDKEILDPRESQIIDVLQRRQASLEDSSVPKINETAIRETLDGYRSFREQEIRTQIDNVAEQNDVIGVLYEEIEEFEMSLRDDLSGYIEIRKEAWADEYEDLEIDLRNFDDYYKEKIKLANLEKEKEEEGDAGIFTHVDSDNVPEDDSEDEPEDTSGDAGIFTHVDSDSNSDDGINITESYDGGTDLNTSEGDKEDTSGDAGIFTHVDSDNVPEDDSEDEPEDTSGDAGIFTHVDSEETDNIENDAFDKPLYDRRIVDLIISGKEGYLETYEAILNKQKQLIADLERSIKSEDNSLLVQKYTRTLELIKQDQVNLNNSLEKLLRYKEVIISLAEKLEMIDYVLSGGIDREILSGYEEYLRMENKELLAIQERYSAEMRQSLDVYQMEQAEAQEILKYSLEHLNNLNLK